MTSNTKIDIRLERDPRYVAAKARLTELQTEFNAAEKRRDDVLGRVNSIGAHNRDKISEEASALLSGASIPATVNRETLIKTFDELTHRVRVLRQAVEMQKSIVGELRAEVSTAIARDLLPRHRAIVTRIADAVFQLDCVLQEEHELRDALYERNVAYSGVIRSTQFPGWGRLESPSSRVSTFILELYADDLLPLSKIPEKLKPWALAKKHKPMPAPLVRAPANVDGWGPTG